LKSPPLHRAGVLKALRHRAEEGLAAAGAAARPLSQGRMRGLVQDLRVYEAGLEIQNEELCTTREELERSQQKYFKHYDLAPVGMIRLNPKGVILEIVEREKRRFGQDSHDDLCQQLTGIALLGVAFRERLHARSLIPEAEQAGKLATLMAEPMQSAREIARGLHPVELDTPGLAAALGALAERTERESKTPWVFQAWEPLGVADDEQAFHLYRIAQEAVCNALKHARARRIVISLRGETRRLTLAIDDDGRGLPMRTARTPGMGISIMRHRAERLGGTLTIEPGPERGTRVLCTVPLARGKRAPSAKPAAGKKRAGGRAKKT